MKQVPAGNKGLGKLPKKVRNKMGYMNEGGMTAKKKQDMMGMGMYGGGMTKKKGYNKGGYCGASNPAERPMKKSK